MSYFPNSHSFQVNNSSFTHIDQSYSRIESAFNVHNDNSTHTSAHVDSINIFSLSPDNSSANGAGMAELLAHSIPGARHDSSERYPPPLCHPDTRQNFIRELTEWCHESASTPYKRLAWMKGPAGVGKSAIAQSMVQVLGAKLAAAFFFSRPNRRNDPERFVTSIAYQLAMKHHVLRHLLDQKIDDDPAILSKSLPFQFEEILVDPFRAMKQQGLVFPETVILVDGLDECDGESAQQQIVQIVAQSLHHDFLHFRWIFFSRLEPHLVSIFNLPDIGLLATHFELTVTRDLDPEIHLFLASRIQEIRRMHGLDESWPSEKDFHTLVDISAGLFACAHALALYIEDPEGAATPPQRLDIVLGLDSQAKTQNSSPHPLSPLDLLYTLILERLHPNRVKAVQLVLLANYLHLESDIYFTQTTPATVCANLLGHSQEDFLIICRSLHTVMQFVDVERGLEFYHASFMDFMMEPSRSREYCIWPSIPQLLRMVVKYFESVHLDTRLRPVSPLSWKCSPNRGDSALQYHNLCHALFELLELMIVHDIQGSEAYELLKKFDFRMLLLTLAEELRVTWRHSRTQDLLPRLRFGNIRSNNFQLKSLFRPIPLSYRLKHMGILWFRQLMAKAMKEHLSGPEYFVIGDAERRILFVVFWGEAVSYAYPYSRKVMEKLKEELIEAHAPNGNFRG
ncbi:hypothetical protein NP233_g11659 [Leucocoprinus birnbaumii]|uniref:Nephrocystin 3-like N-terminal domain-containing protein n=1 Tax=Leucocoprinus birnbaumii TaxID=56174 RepID=A0AAD5VHZ7_9AGAR|nr:hypothetical protein NP233_g11659 [Leucocoprinus birnbaumii]